MQRTWNLQPFFEAAGTTGVGGHEEIDVTNAGGDKDDDLDSEVASLAVDDGKGNKMVPLSALVGAKKEAKASAKRVKELEPIAARASDIEDKLGKAQPLIDALVTNPKLRAEALRAVQGTITSNGRVEQPDEREDPDAAAIAEEFGFYLNDNTTPDLARGRRVLERLDARGGRMVDERIRPLAGAVVGSRAERNIQDAIAQVDERTGAPLATRESIEETINLLGGSKSPLLADPKVVDLIINNAIGLDHRKGRAPKPVDEPMFMERQGGGRGGRTEAIDSDTRRMMGRTGLTDKDMTAALGKLSSTTPGRGVKLE